MIDDFFANQLIMGPLRALIPALVAWLLGHHYLPDWLPLSEFDAFVIAALSALWSRQVHKQAGVPQPPPPTPMPVSTPT